MRSRFAGETTVRNFRKRRSGEERSKRRSAVWGKTGDEPAAVDVEGFEDLKDGFDGNAPVLGPGDDVEVFLPFLETVEDAIEKKRVVLELALQEAEVAAVELDPEARPLEMLEPAGTQVAPPVVLDPAADGSLAQVAAGLLALDPLVAQRFLLAVHVDA